MEPEKTNLNECQTKLLVLTLGETWFVSLVEDVQLKSTLWTNFVNFGWGRIWNGPRSLWFVLPLQKDQCWFVGVKKPAPPSPKLALLCRRSTLVITGLGYLHKVGLNLDHKFSPTLCIWALCAKLIQTFHALSNVYLWTAWLTINIPHIIYPSP